MTLPKPRLPLIAIPLLMALFFAFAFNFPLLGKVYEALAKLEHINIGFAFSIPFFLVSAFNVIFTLLAIRFVIKPLFIFLILLSSILTYSAHTYGVVFDKGMMTNIMETDTGESLSYLNLSVAAWFFGLGVIPALLLWRTEIVYPPFKKSFLQKTFSILLSLAVIGLIAAFYFKDYASVIRNNPMLKKQVIPTYALDSAFGYTKRKYFTKPLVHRAIGVDSVQYDADIGMKKELVILVVGETQRAMNYELNGYARPTNSYTKKHDIINFPNTTSCGTATAHSVPCMFSNLGHSDYNERIAKSQDSLMDVVSRSGVYTLWIDNDSGCKDVCNNVAYIDIRQKYKDNREYCAGEGCYDSAFLTEFEEQYKKLPDATSLVVLHIMGSHGPTYYQRYPESHRVFTPDCPRSDIQNCTQEELVNTYDNTILYSDYVIAGIIDILKKNDKQRNAALLFMSDHGESLGEKGVYLHGLPYAIAPDEQKKIPFMTWMSKGFADDRGIDQACVREKLSHLEYSHDNMFHTVMGLLDVKADVYREDKDVFIPCRTVPEYEKAEWPVNHPTNTAGKP